MWTSKSNNLLYSIFRIWRCDDLLLLCSLRNFLCSPVVFVDNQSMHLPGARSGWYRPLSGGGSGHFRKSSCDFRAHVVIVKDKLPDLGRIWYLIEHPNLTPQCVSSLHRYFQLWSCILLDGQMPHGYHGYWTKDLTKVNPAYGTEDPGRVC